MRGVAYLLGAKEPLPHWAGAPGESDEPSRSTTELPSLEAISADKVEFARMTRL